jgi:hypothetical protein
MNTKKYTFLDGDVVVDVPEVAGKKLRPVKLDIGPVDMDPKTGDFKPIRVVANIALEDEANPGKYLTELGESVEIQVRYRPDDMKAARKDNKPLALGFWDGQRWIRFTREKHNFELRPDSAVEDSGFGVIVINRWGDPPTSWGR